MSASPAPSGRRVLATAIARASAWLVEPVERAPSEPLAIRPRPVTAVVGLAPRCGTTTVARALAVELGARDTARAAVVAGPRSTRGARLEIRFASSAATTLAGALQELGVADARPVGRLGLVPDEDAAGLAAAVRHRAPLVLDVAHGTPPGVPASLADHAVLVASPRTEPALAAAVGESLARVGPRPVVVVNRAQEAAGWEPVPHLLPEARAAAHLARAGRRPVGALAAAVAGLADDCERPQAAW